ncbi:sperm-associated antigen 1-like [Asterias amurensis]|uniref:sperm-associated antigen 1-like n=1 Tax=Asterias amurensis TaxID=7602 RepID=UPI003AB5E66F
MDCPSNQMRNLLGAKSTSSHSVPIEHMDYGYIGKCTDLKELEKILRALRTGEEGFYPELIIYCEKQIEKLDPKSRTLRKDKPPTSMMGLDKEEQQQLNSDIKDWTAKMNSTTISSSGLDKEDDDLPPVRNSVNVNTQGKKNEDKCWAKPSPDRIKSSDYRAWDKFDVDTAAEEVDKESGAKKAQKRKADLASIIKTEGMSDADRELVANKEKDKGNEAFKAGDFDEAVQYYTRSISVIPSAPSYNNRSLARIKLGQFTGAVEDCTKVLKLEPENIKALLRRGTARKSLKEFVAAKEDLEAVLKAEPNNKQAKDLLADILTKEDNPEQKMAGGKKGAKALPNKTSSNSKGKRMVIQEVEGDSDSEDEAGGQRLLVNGTGSPTSDDGASVKELNHMNGGDGRVKEVEQPVEKKQDAKVTELPPVKPAAPVVPPPELPGDVIKLKDSGNTLFKAGQYGEAMEKYSKAINKILPEKESFSLALATLYSNRAACQSKTGHLKEAIADCDLALAIQPYSTKVLLRRASAYETLEKYRQAYVDFQSALKLDGLNENACSGSNRMIKTLSDMDGPRWREKLPATPSILGMPLPPPSLTTMAPSNARVPSVTSTTNATQKTTMVSSTTPISPKGQTNPAAKSPEVKVDNKGPKEPPAKATEKGNVKGQQEKQEPKVKANNAEPQGGEDKVKLGSEVKGGVEPSATIDPKLSKEDNFKKLKADGNSFVQKGNYAKAMEFYTACIAVDPDQAVSYTNRALCFLKLNKGNEAETDCTRALELGDGNVKALYRRALARKMLQKYIDSVRDLSTLLKIEPQNVSAKKELDQVKEQWRQELKNNQQKAAEKPKQNTPSEPEKPAGVKPPEIKTSEVKSPGAKITEIKTSGVKAAEVKASGVTSPEVRTSGVKSAEAKASGVKSAEVKSSGVKSSGVKSSGVKSGKKKGKRMQIQETEGSSEEENNSKENKPKPSERVQAKEKKGNNKAPKVTGNKTAEKTPPVQNDTVTVPKLKKVTAYEFLQAWTSLKRSRDTGAYAELLKQITPEELPEVLTNKLDGDMVTNFVKAVCEHLIESDGDLSYGLLANLAKVERFKTVALFLSNSDKKRLTNSLKKLGAKKTTVYSPADLKNLKQQYSI